ncbi:lytic transglycosylase domain-containing protein [Pectobacterium brasiliense]|uniref:lytic transglycosylase domain-containing protein n=1 Tax=Pectobacterium TaxID=122277 RepID=UPI001CE0E5B0|nr:MULTISPECIES: lytic transglycosylase domain-containing protein [Pectobacterium]MCA5919115.1 lytic transglycosylase domain-containing protein [Pectobacterium brasiliense]MCA5925560.1 lytic transglycosylase domain-containing protein [Pectobacterium brasiliense]MCA5934979.1 lytic transglycosylase domain-containing protein [Pectobacterium brasiliense]MCA5941291.1 lytic transglycosylase domain-containing protein [Pectobacterium brasiliense]MCA5944796.1 lytic transglycosylase domain-containing pr
MLSPTAFLAAVMQCAATIHPSTAFDVAKVESSFNPYAVAEIVPKEERAPDSVGVISHQPTSKQTAINIIKQVVARGRRYSVGLMQITSTNFRHYGVTANDLLDPCTNLSVFERILTDCYQRGGTLKRALSCYYSGNFDTGQQPESAFNQTSYIQRIGYAVPSTREDLKRSTTYKSTSDIHYPTTVLRGEITDKTTPVLTSLHYPVAILRGDVSLPVINEEQ